MASMALTCCASLSAPLVSSRTPSKVIGLLGPCSVSFAVPKKKPCLKSGNLVLRAQQSGGDFIEGQHHVDVQILEINANPNQSWAVERPVQSVPVHILPYGLIDSFSNLRSEMVVLMDRLLEETMAMSKRKGEVLQPRIPWEVMENDTEYKIRFDMPGVSVGGVEVKVADNNVLIIKGEPRMVNRSDGAWAKPSYYSSYDTWFQLPDNCQVNKIDAIVKDGVLYISVPKIPSEVPE